MPLSLAPSRPLLLLPGPDSGAAHRQLDAEHLLDKSPRARALHNVLIHTSGSGGSGLRIKVWGSGSGCKGARVYLQSNFGTSGSGFMCEGVWVYLLSNLATRGSALWILERPFIISSRIPSGPSPRVSAPSHNCAQAMISSIPKGAI